MINYAKHINNRVVGFFSCEDTPVVEQGVGYIATETEVLSWPLSDSDTSVLYVDNAGVLYWVETATLAEIKIKKNAEINLARLSANRSTFPFAGKDIACDELSRSDIDAVNGIVSLTGALPPGWAGLWKATDNSYVAVGDLTAWTNFYVAMVTKGSSNFAHAQALKAQLAAATTVEEVGAISWD